MSLRSSQLIELDRALRALHVQAAGGVLLLGPQQVVGLLADLRAGRSTGRCGRSRSRCAPAPAWARTRPGSASAAGAGGQGLDDGAALQAGGRGAACGHGVSPWRVVALRLRASAQRRFWQPRRALCRACTPRLPIRARAARGFPAGRRPRRLSGPAAADTLAGARLAAARRPAMASTASAMSTDEVAAAERAGFWARLDRPPVPRPEVRPVRRHRLRRPHGHRARRRRGADAAGGQPPPRHALAVAGARLARSAT